MDVQLWEQACKSVSQFSEEELRQFLFERLRNDYPNVLRSYVQRKHVGRSYALNLANFLVGQVFRRYPIKVFRSYDPQATAFFDVKEKAVYVNATFLRYLSLLVNESAKKDVEVDLEKDDLSVVVHFAVLFHELLHGFLGHYRTGPSQVDVALEYCPKVPRRVMQVLANLCMDFIINRGFLASFLPDAFSLLKEHDLVLYSTNSIFKVVDATFKLDDALKKELNALLKDEEKVLEKTWSDAFWGLVNVLKKANLKVEEVEDVDGFLEKLLEKVGRVLVGGVIVRGGHFNEESGAEAREVEKEDAKDGQKAEEKGSSPKRIRISTIDGVVEVEVDVVVDEDFCASSDPTSRTYQNEAFLENARRNFIEKVRAAGLGTGGFIRELDASLPVDLRQVERILSEKFFEVVERNYWRYAYSSWTKINRRLPGVLPGHVKSHEDGRLHAFVDASGSMTDFDLKVIASLLKAIVTQRKTVKDVYLYPFDGGLTQEVVHLQSEYDFELKNKIVGGGGTELTPALVEVLNKSESGDWRYEVREGDLACVFTDGMLADVFFSEQLEKLTRSLKRFSEVTGKPVVFFVVGSEDFLPEAIKTIATRVGPKVVDVYVLNVPAGKLKSVPSTKETPAEEVKVEEVKVVKANVNLTSRLR